MFVIIAVILIVAAVIIAVVLKSGHRVIKVDDMDGEVSLERDSSEKDIVEGMNLKSKDMVTTGDDGLLELLVDTDKHILAKQNTCFEIVSNGNEKKGKLKIKLEYGSSLIEIENKLNENSSVEVETPNASLSVRGTTFEVSYSKEDESTFVEVTEGVVEVEAGDEKKTIKEGQTANVSEVGIIVADKDFQIGHSEKEEEEDREIGISETGPEETVPVDDFVLSEEPIYELESVDPEKLISADEVPNLFNGAVTFEELQYAIRIRDYSRLKQSQDTIKNALEIMCYEPEIAGVYSPMPGTKYSYDAEHLNRIFSVITTYWILDEFLPEGATCPWPENILTLVPVNGPQVDKNYVRIIRIYYGEEESEVCVDYNFRQNYNAEGTSYREGTCCMFFAIDEETGKYRSNYIMQYGSHEVYPE